MIEALYLDEADVAALLDAEVAIYAIEACEHRLAAGEIDVMPRERLPLVDGQLALMAASDHGLGLTGHKSYAATPAGARFLVVLFAEGSGELVAIIEADRLGQLRTGAASAVAAQALARASTSSLGVIGCGKQARAQVECIRAALPRIEKVTAYCRSRERLEAFCAETGAIAADDHASAARADVVVTATTARDPVLRGDWLREGTLVCAIGANQPDRRELDNGVLERASFVCCDLRVQAERESGDLIEPAAAGVLDWLEVHELHEVVAGEVTGRHDPTDIVLFKSNGIAAWDVAVGAAVVERARAAGRGRKL